VGRFRVKETPFLPIFRGFCVADWYNPDVTAIVETPNSADFPPGPAKPPVETAITVRAVSGIPFRQAFGNGYHFRVSLLSGVGFLVGILALWVFGYVFWVFLESLALAMGWERGNSLLLALSNRLGGIGSLLLYGSGWPLDLGAALGLLATWAAIYLYFDRLALHGNRRAREVLMHKAEVLLRPSLGNLPESRSFVEVRRTTVELPLPPDIGWLFFAPDALIFVGDEFQATFPRSQVRGNPGILRSFAGLGSNWVEVELEAPQGWLRFLPREDSVRLSDTAANVGPLYDTLTTWLKVGKETHSRDAAEC
jgi:hypothetical protein